jgi:hypothetical protein
VTDGQESLFKLGNPVTPLRALTDRQQEIYDLICAQPNGVEAIELGALMHAQSGRHTADEFCKWCPQDGGRALRERAIRQRVIRRAGGVYEPRLEADWTGKAEASSTDQLTALPGESFEDIFSGSDAA